MTALYVAIPLALSVLTAPQGASPEQVVRAFYDAFNARDAQALVGHVTDDVEWMTLAGHAVSIEASGKEPLRASMERYFRSRPTVRAHIEAIMTAGNVVCLHERVTWSQAGSEKSQSAVAVYKIRDGRIASVWYVDVLR